MRSGFGFMKTEEQIREQYRLIRGSLDERGRREWAASEAMSLGRGGIARVHRGTGIVRQQPAKASTSCVAPVQMEDRLKRSVACVVRVAADGAR